MHGHGIDPLPPTFATGLSGHWMQWKGEGPFQGSKCRPARVLDLGFVAAWQQASDAERISDMSAQTDPLARARTVATCALMGMLSVGTAKGLCASPNHSELVQARGRNRATDPGGRDPRKEGKLRSIGTARIKTYTYCPNEHDDPTWRRRQTAMMFCFVHVAMHDREGKYVGFKILMLIFDKGFSTDELVQQGDGGEREISRVGPDQRHAREHAQRASWSGRTSCSARRSRREPGGDGGDAVQAHLHQPGLDQVHGERGRQADGHEGRPYYANMQGTRRPGAPPTPLRSSGRRVGRQAPDRPDGLAQPQALRGTPAPTTRASTCRSRARWTRAASRSTLHPSRSCTPTTGTTAQATSARRSTSSTTAGATSCHDPSVTQHLQRAAAQQMHGNVEPEDCLLRILWKMHKDSNPILSKAQQTRADTFEQNRDSGALALPPHGRTGRPGPAAAQPRGAETEMLSNDSIDKSVAEEAILERRAYGDGAAPRGARRVQGALGAPGRCATSRRAGEGARLVTEWDKQKRAELRSARLQCAARRSTWSSTPRRADAQAAARTTPRRRRRHQARAAAHGARPERQEARKSIPPGYFDVACTGLRSRVKEAGEIAARPQRAQPRPARRPGRPQRARRHGQHRLCAQASRSWPPTSRPLGHWRAFLMHALLQRAAHRRRATSSSCWRCTATRSSRACKPQPRHTHTHRVPAAGSRRSSSCCCAAARAAARACAPSADGAAARGLGQGLGLRLRQERA